MICGRIGDKELVGPFGKKINLFYN